MLGVRGQERLAAGAAMICAAAIASLLGSCDFSEYCLNCGDPTDATPVDGRMMDAMPDACVMADEMCNGADDDCDGEIDEGTLADVGQVCGSDVGECTQGVTECVDGALVCAGASAPTIELCNNLDDDCDGTVDNNAMGTGQICGTNVGQCSSGQTVCESGALVCSGNVEPTPEICDGLDNDCDSVIDNGVPPGAACGPAQGDVGECMLGVEMCLGGIMQCTGAVYPSAEQCDGVPDVTDRDCDGNPLNGFDLANDPLNCNGCGIVCADLFTTMDPYTAALQCNMGTCEIGACQNGHWDLDGVYDNGCEYACTFQGQEVCNLTDDDCDGVVDEGIMPPPNYCSPLGACADPTVLVPICTANGWQCDYANERPNVEVDMNGGIAPESFCDDIDNDCDGAIDEGDPLKGAACDDGLQGICQSTGIYQCAADPAAPMDCVIDTPGQPMGTEACNNLDDDCDGVVDENPPGGDINSWVMLPNGVEIFAYEASRPDATPTSAGNIVIGKPCSKAGVWPWANIKYPDAEAACEALGPGARLCTEADWSFACEGPALASPRSQDPMGDQLVIIEAEWPDAITAQGTPLHDWVLSGAASGYSRNGFMRAEPDDDTSVNGPQAPTESPRLDYVVDFATTGTHYVWIRGLSPNSSGNRVHMGMDFTVLATGIGGNGFSSNNWEWVEVDESSVRVAINVATAGLHTINVWMDEDGFMFDKMVLTTNANYVPTGYGPQEYGCTWGYGASCDTYQPDTCNGSDYDTDPVTPDNQDSPVPTGSLAACYSDWNMAGQVFDLSGNLKEWTYARAPGINPIRGGSYNNTAGGTTCQFDFTAADDNFFFPNVGFRCCRDVP